MASLTEIQNRIDSIRDTMKITKAMNMISSNKLRKAKADLEANQPFMSALDNEIRRILRHTPEFQHVYFDNRDSDALETVKRTGFIIVTADKGMAGAYNHNVLKEAENRINACADPHIYVVGQVGYKYFEQKGIPIADSFHYTAQNPTLYRAREIAKYIIKLYLEESLDEVYLIYTRMINGIAEEVTCDKLLPLVQSKFLPQIPAELAMNMYQEEFILLPSADALIENLVPDYLTGMIFGGLIMSFCCEQNARMMAMDSATRNGEEMLKDLQITFNRLRQSAITQEITEVVGGARALKRKKAANK